MRLGFHHYLHLYILSVVSLNAFVLTKFVFSMQSTCSDHERLALLNFKHSFQIDCAFSNHSPFVRPTMKSWRIAEKGDCCLWDGVQCDEETGQIIGLDLSSSCLYGPFPPNSTLFGLYHLKELNLAYNNFNFSQIPAQFGQFHKLNSLDLSNSAFTGQIPLEISKLSHLSVLDLSNSYIPAYSALNLRVYDPTIDKLVRNLTSLQILKLDMVDMSTFPATLANLTSLKVLSLKLCDLYGELPSNLFHLPLLEVLNIGGNSDLTEFLPEFQWHSPLKELTLSFTSLSGELPNSIGKLAHLEKLALAECRFSGLLPSSLSNLTTLTFLALEGNNFHGDIPFSLTNLTNLEVLVLSNLNMKPGQLFSQLPKLRKLTILGLNGMKLETENFYLLGNFTRLQILDLGNTNLKGPCPYWLANLTKLNELSLNNNELIGPIPRWVSQLNNLNHLQLVGNKLFGKFEIFYKLKNLLSLDLSNNNITFPPISKINDSLIQLEIFGFSGCNLTEFPQFLKHQNQLQSLSLDNNNIRGSIPQWFVNITKESLLYIDLSKNNLAGFEKPTLVLPWNNLEYIDLSNNKFQYQLPIPPNSIKEYFSSSNLISGDIPNQICNVRSLISLDLSSNMLSGPIPHCVASQLGDTLKMLDLRSNNLTGTMPPAFTNSCKFQMINLSNNELEGELPKSLANCSMLEVLDIGRNWITDTFPAFLGSLPKLRILVLNHNNFFGRIRDPKSGHDFSSLQIIDLSSNLHGGDLPFRYLQIWHEMEISKENQSDTSNSMIYSFYQVGPRVISYEKELDYSMTITNKGSERLYVKILKLFKVVDFSSNNFTGRIPDNIGNLRGLQALNLSNNNLHGRIPPSLSNMIDLESLDLSQNILSGDIPLALSQLTSLEVFNVSYNRLEGQIPTGNQFNTFDKKSFLGNLGLCGTPLPQECEKPNSPQPPPEAMTQDEGNENSELIDWIIRSIGYLTGCVVGYVIGKLYITDKYHELFMEIFGRHRFLSLWSGHQDTRVEHFRGSP